MLIAAFLLMALPGPVPAGPGSSPPGASEERAAIQRDRRRLPTIITLCSKAVASGDIDLAVRQFADTNGLSTYGRLALTTNCRLYEQGLRDGLRRR